MSKNQIPFEDEVPKHKKKSKKKGQPRADHKHEYKTVLLHSYYDSPFRPEKIEYKRPVKVCEICGRVGDVNLDQYERVYAERFGKRMVCTEVIKNESSLEKWYLDDYFDKFAHR